MFLGTCRQAENLCGRTRASNSNCLEYLIKNYLNVFMGMQSWLRFKITNGWDRISARAFAGPRAQLRFCAVRVM